MSLPISPITGQPSALRAIVERSVGIAPQQPQPAPQPQPQPPRQKSYVPDLAATLRAAVAEAMAPIAAHLDNLNYQLGGYPPPAQPVTKSDYVSVRDAARRNLGPTIAAVTAKGPQVLDGVTAQMLERQRAVYRQQLEYKSHLAETQAGNASPGYHGLMAGQNAVAAARGPAGSPEATVHY